MHIITGILNEDGTYFRPPINPLKDKWDRLYPPNQRHEDKTTCEGYSCMRCSLCPHGSFWKVPEEDKEIYERHIENLDRYLKLHNPTLYRGGEV